MVLLHLNHLNFNQMLNSDTATSEHKSTKATKTTTSAKPTKPTKPTKSIYLQKGKDAAAEPQEEELDDADPAMIMPEVSKGLRW
jgi:hypothetical protein